MLGEAAAVWQDVVMVASEYKDGVATGEMTINFVDGKTNSLKQINQFIEKMNAAKKANKVAYEDNGVNVYADTTATFTTPPPPSPAEPSGKK
jgi:hypothetical protein